MPLELVDRLPDDAGVVLGEPVPKEIVRDLHDDGLALVLQKRGWPEPGVEAVAVNLGLDKNENLIPNVPGHRGTQIGTLGQNRLLGAVSAVPSCRPQEGGRRGPLERLNTVKTDKKCAIT